ncbi:metallophosphoesterase family protein [soil metagenome]
MSDTIAVIGDIHGCFYTLSDLYKKLILQTSEIYSVGDLVDRGPKSKDVVQFCIDKNIIPVKGNHEDMLLKAIEGKDSYGHYMNGGNATEISYTGLSKHKQLDIYKEALESSGHLKYLNSLPLKIETGDVLISHAGIIKNGDDRTIMWNREEELLKLDKFQIIGHTPVKEPLFEKGWYMNIDTGCVYGNKLTGIILERTGGKLLEIIQSKLRDSFY